MSRVCDVGRREEERCWERAGSVAKWSPWDSANLPRRKECRAGEMQSAGNCGCSSTQASPSSAGPEPPPRPLTPTQLPAPRGHIPFLVSGSILCGNHQSWAPAASWTPSLAELCVFGSQRPLRAGAVAPGRQLLGGCFSLIYSSYYLQQTEVSKNPRPSICHLPPTDKYSSLAHLFLF